MTEMNMKTLVILTCVAGVSGCSSYKPRDDGFFNVGYEETALADGRYQLIYYGSDHDDAEDVKQLWHRRARELCAGAEYRAEHTLTGTWTSNGYVALPPVLVAADNVNLTYRGGVLCQSETDLDLPHGTGQNK
jgi:hypothetical protein